MSETPTQDLRTADDGRPPAPTGPVVGSMVWGGALVLLGVLSILTAAFGWQLDPVIVLIGVLALAGVALVAGAVAALLRRP